MCVLSYLFEEDVVELVGSDPRSILSSESSDLVLILSTSVMISPAIGEEVYSVKVRTLNMKLDLDQCKKKAKT